VTRAAQAVALAALAGLLAAPGCVEPCPETLRSLDEVLAEYNANADALPRLWARAEVSVTLDAPDTPSYTWHSGHATCLLLLAKGPQRLRLDPVELLTLPRPLRVLLLRKARERIRPHDFVLIGRETAAVELFRMGSSAAQGVDYFWYRFGERGKAWFARPGGLGGGRGLPMDPMQMLSVLAVCALPDDPAKLPAVALSMRNAPGDCAYVVTLIDRQPVTGRVLFLREVHFRWSDTEPCRPFRVDLLDAAGRRVMTAHLRDYKPVDVSDLDEAPAVEPVMPTDIEIVANPFGGRTPLVRRVHLRLSEMTAEDRWDRAACDFAPPDGVEAVPVDRGVRAPKPGGGKGP